MSTEHGNGSKLSEETRLAALRSLSILDTLPEQGFEDATELASFVCGTPVSLVSLVDQDRQWFKSARGLEIRETPRSQSFCAHTIGTAETLIVQDARQDSRFRENPLVAGEPGIRFYAGAPLVDGDGQVLGTLCVIDKVPRELSARQKAALEALARQVMGLLEQRQTIAAQAKVSREFEGVAARLTVAAEAAELGIFSWEPVGDRATWENDRMYQILGRTREQGPVKAATFLAEVVHPEHGASFTAALQRTMETGERFFWQGRFRRGNGTDGWLEFTGKVERGADGAPFRLLGTALDITARREVEQALRSSEERLRLAQESARIASWDWDLDTGRLFWSGDSRWIYGCPPEEVAHSDQIVARVHKDDVDGWQKGLQPVLEGTGEFHAEFRVCWADGSTHWIMGHGVPVFSGSKVVRVVGTKLNVTVQRRTEAALRQSEKLAAVGRLASTIAHEINNPLESVTNLLYLAKGNEELPREAWEYLDTAERELSRASVITNQTLRFHKQASDPKPVTCGELFGSVLRMYQSRLGNSRIEVRERIRATEAVVCFDGEIRQVLTNLIGNAIDAMAPGGRLLLRGRNATEWATGRKGLALTVADTGCGMSAATLGKVFEAFFTTKGVRGTGLGLWISKDIVDRHDGTLRVRSREAEAHRGTVCTLFLPLVPVEG